jgi:hypothetical protein
MSRRHKKPVAGSLDFTGDAIPQRQFAADHKIWTIGIVQMAVRAAGFKENPGRVPLIQLRICEATPFWLVDTAAVTVILPC